MGITCGSHVDHMQIHAYILHVEHQLGIYVRTYLLPSNELISEDCPQDILQTVLGLDQTASSCQEGELEGSCDAYLCDEGLERWGQSERHRVIGIQVTCNINR